MIKILTRYQDYKNADEIVRRTVREKLASEHRDVCTADELTEMVQRQLEDHKVQQSDATELWQLEKQIQPVLQLVRTRKTQLMLGDVKALQEKKNQLSKEKQVLEREILAERLNEGNVDG
nr:truncated transcription factor CAULIFLOWER A-like [Tanacetum cinerariifolium]